MARIQRSGYRPQADKRLTVALTISWAQCGPAAALRQSGFSQRRL